MRRRVLAALVVAAVLAGCSDDGGEAGPGTASVDGAAQPVTSAPATASSTAPVPTTGPPGPAAAAPTTAAPTTVGPATGPAATVPPVLGSADASAPVAVSDAFYVPPSPLPGSGPGDLIRVEKAADFDGGTLYRILHRSETVGGDPVAVSGQLLVPDGEPPTGGWPVITWAHGTTGSADTCAPSRTPLGQLPVPERLVAEGFVVVATDYEGLGTPGPHPYLVGASEGRGVLDAARAALRALPGRTSGTVAVWGHSQGGQAALWAGELADVHAPELDVVGVVAHAPVAEMRTWLDTMRGNPFTSGLLFAAAAGAAAADPSLDLADALTPEALEQLPLLEDRCIGEVSVAVAGLAGRVLQPDLPPAWLDTIDAAGAGRRRSEPPVLVFQGGRDPLVPAATVEVYVERACAAGTTLEYVLDPAEDHGSVLGDNVGAALDWMRDRAAGEPARSTC